MTPFSETRRQVVHMAMGGFALLLRALTWWQAAALATGALLFNLFALPHLGGRSLYRTADELRGFPAGIVLYPAAVLLLILAFPRRPDIVAAAWGILAVGDGSATLVGRAVGGPRIPWNPEKTIAGTTAFIVFGACAGIFFAWWTRAAVTPPPPITFVTVAPLLAAVAAAAVETIPVRLDDNLAVPVTAGAALWICSLVAAEPWMAARPGLWHALLPAVMLNALFAFAGFRLRTVGKAGGVAGAIIGTIIFVCTGGAGWTLLFLTFVVASATSRIGLKRKSVLGIAEERGGRRGAGNAFANCGVAAIAAALAVMTPFHDAALLAFVAALTAGGSDTVASEIGKAWGRHTFLVTGFGRVPPGTSGAVSIEGTAAGFVAASLLAAVGVAGQLIAAPLLWVAVAGATVGAFVESVLGATLEKRGIVNNDMLNFINTAIAAITALLLARLVR